MVYPLIALAMYLLLLYFIRKSGVKHLMKMMESGGIDAPMNEFMRRYGPKILKMFGGAIVNDLVSVLDAKMRGKMGAIQKKVLKTEADADEYVDNFITQQFPVIGGIADAFGIDLPDNPVLQQIAMPMLASAEQGAQARIMGIINKMQNLNNPGQPNVPQGENGNGMEMSQMLLQHPELLRHAEALLQEASQVEGQSCAEQGKGQEGPQVPAAEVPQETVGDTP